MVHLTLFSFNYLYLLARLLRLSLLAQLVQVGLIEWQELVDSFSELRFQPSYCPSNRKESGIS